jgi:hypothetical protein
MHFLKRKGQNPIPKPPALRLKGVIAHYSRQNGTEKKQIALSVNTG